MPCRLNGYCYDGRQDGASFHAHLFRGDPLHTSQSSQLERQVIQYLGSLSYRERDLKTFLHQIALGVSNLMDIDWSVVTLNQDPYDRILASSIDIGEAANQLYPLHGTVTQTVVSTGCPLTVKDTQVHMEYGQTPDGYRAYLGVPLRAPTGEVLGTICSFHQVPRSFSADEIHYAELFAERAATALDNYQLYQRQLDFNERLEAEVVKRTEELRATQAQLIEKERLAAIGEFTSMIVHEIRNPLTTIGMGLKSLGRLDLSEVDRLRLNLASEEEGRLKELLNEILQYAKPQVLETSTLDLNQLVQETVMVLAEQPELASRQIDLSLHSAPLAVAGDRAKLKQVLINLISNACEAVNPGDKVTVTLDHIADFSQAQVQVHNGGDPIPADILPKLTQPFFSTKSAGNGLGLAIVKRIIEAHQGILNIQSSLEAGTCISMNLPLDKAAIAES